MDLRLLGPQDGPLPDRVEPDVFDHPVNARWAAEFLADPRHHLAVAVEDERVVGFASAVHYVHPDKPPELWINEVGVSPEHQRRGLARRLLSVLCAHGRALGCAQAWVLTEPDNGPARALYEAAGGRPAEVVLYEFALES